MEVGEDTPRLSGSSKLNFLVLYAKECQEVELGLWEVSPSCTMVHLDREAQHQRRGLPAGAYPKTGYSCMEEAVCPVWVRLLVDEAKDKCREKLHQNSGHRPSLEASQPGRHPRTSEGVGKVMKQQRSRDSQETWVGCYSILCVCVCPRRHFIWVHRS